MKNKLENAYEKFSHLNDFLTLRYQVSLKFVFLSCASVLCFSFQNPPYYTDLLLMRSQLKAGQSSSAMVLYVQKMSSGNNDVFQISAYFLH